MKCLSLRQPFAELIVSGRKTIELRSWNTDHRGRFLVHASLKTDKEACRRFGIDPDTLRNGALVGSANIDEVKTYKTLKSFMADTSGHRATGAAFHVPTYGFRISKPERLKRPIACKGRLGFFKYSK